MAIHCVRPDFSSEFRNPFDCDELIVKALVTVSAFVALADGRLDAIERDDAVNYIERQRLAPTISRERIAEFFDARARHRRQRFRRSDCRGASTSGGLIADLRCGSNCRAGRRGGSAPGSQRSTSG